MPINPINVTPTVISGINPFSDVCPSNFTPHKGPIGGWGGLSGRLSVDARAELEAYYYDQDTKYGLSKFAFDSLLDGGNTDTLVAAIDAADISSIPTLYTHLQAISPFISSLALRALGGRSDLLSDSQMYLIFTVNKVGVHEDTLLPYLNGRSPSFMAWMLDSLAALADTTDGRLRLQSLVSDSRSERDIAAGLIAMDILTYTEDSDTISYPSLRYWIGNRKSAVSEYQIADNFMDLGCIDSATAILDSVPFHYALNSREADEYDDLVTINDLMIDVINDKRTALELNETEHSILSDIADEGVGLAQVRACNILHFAYNTPCPFDITLPGGSARLMEQKTNRIQENATTNNELPKFTIYPNPTMDYINVLYQTNSTIAPDHICISDINGRVIYSEKLNEHSSAIKIDTKLWSEGTFICTIFVNGKNIGNKKVVIIR